MKNKLIAVLAIAITACSTNAPTDQPIASAPKAGRPVAVSGSAALEKFGFMFGRGSAAKSEVIEGDFTCDGSTDIVVGASHLDHVQGPRFEVMLLTGHSGEIEAASQSIKYLESNPDDSSHRFSYFLGSGMPSPSIEIVEVGKTALSTAVASDAVCNTVIRVTGSGGLRYVFVFDEVYDSLLKKRRLGVREGLELEANEGDYDFFTIHMI